MICPTCGADVSPSRFCQNCGASLSAVETEPVFDVPGAFDAPGSPDALDVPDTAAAADASAPAFTQEGPQAGLPGQPMGVYQWNDVPQDAQAVRFGAAPSMAFALAIVGLVLSLLGFSLVTIVPGLALSIAALALNAKYGREGRDNPRKTPTTVLGVIGVVVALAMIAVVALAGAFAFKAYEIYEQDGELHELVDGLAGEDPDELEGAEGAGNAGLSAAGEAVGGEARAGAAGVAGAASASTDPLAFDSFGNPTLYAVCELDGEQLGEQLEAQGYAWVDSAGTWMSQSGALLEAQDGNGMLDQGGIARLDAGAAGSSVAYIVMAVGYDTPDAALQGLSADVTVKDTYIAEDGEIAMAVLRGADGGKRLAAVTKTGDGQHTVLVFTGQAVESGLFSKITGVDAGDSIDDVWKVVKAS